MTLRSSPAARALGPIFLGLGILSKESTLALPLVLVAIRVVRGRRDGESLTGYLAVPLVLVAWRLALFGTLGSTRISAGLAWPANVATSTLWLLIPADGEWLAHVLRNTFLSHAGVRLLLGAAAVAALSLALRRRGPLLVGLACTGFMILLPALAGVHARYLYLPSLVAVPALLAWLALTLYHRPPEPVNRASPRRRALVVVLVLMICGGYLAGAENWTNMKYSALWKTCKTGWPPVS